MIIKNGKRLDGFCVDSLPIGTLQPFLGLKAPNGYLICDGSLISKTVYPDLYAICGSLFGVETSTHFYLPDLRGKTIAGYNENNADMNTIGKLLGEEAHRHITPTSWMQYQDTYWHGFTNDLGYVTRDLKTFYGSEVTQQGKVPEMATNLLNYYTDTQTNYQPTMVANWIVKAKMIVPITAIVENTLGSISENNALSAAQGKVLNDKINSLSTVASTGSYNDLVNKPERVDYISQITCNYGTLNSNFNYCFLKDDVVYLNLTYTLNTALTAGTQYDFCKIPAAIRPKGNVIMYAFSHTVSHMITNYVRSTGELVIAPEKAVPAGKEINMWTVYYIK